MNILWITNIILPYPANKLNIKNTPFGGWIKSLLKDVYKEQKIKIAIGTVYNGKELLKFTNDNITYYLLPGKLNSKYNKKIENYWKIVNEEFKPDIVHLHGSEFSHGLAFINVCPNVRSVLSVQGLVSECAKNYLSNINKLDIIKNITFRDIVRRDNILQQKNKFKNRGKNEIEIIKKVDFVIGRTKWDYDRVKEINPKIKYFANNENLREVFYNNNWKIENIERNTIFVSQGSWPIKGVHILLKAIQLVKQQNKNVVVYVAGTNITKNDTILDKLKLSGYGKYLIKLIKKLNLQNNVKFVGELDENQVVSMMLKSNIFVLPSKLENSSNSLCEAMMLGVPCIVSNTGGTSSLFRKDIDGYMYEYSNYSELSQKIIDLFKNDKLCKEFSEAEVKVARQRHNNKNNVTKLLDIYSTILKEDNSRKNSKILYISSATSKNVFKMNMTNMKKQKSIYGMPVASNKFHNLIIKGLRLNNCDVTSLSIRPISKETHDKIYWKKVEEYQEEILYKYPTIININGIKQILNGINVFLAILHWNNCNKNNKKIIIYDATYVTIIPFIILASNLTKISKIGIFADIYSYMSDVQDNNKKINLIGKIVRKIMSKCYKKTDKYIFLSQQMNDIINMNNKPYYIMEGISDSDNSMQKHINSTDKKVIMYAGALKEEYGLEILLEGFNKLKKDNIELWIFGDGNYINVIEEFSKVDKRIKYCGNVSNQQIIEIESKIDVLINPRPTKLEFTKYSFPSKIIEYMSSGTPVLTTKLPTIPKEYYKYLYFIKDESSNGIKDALEEVINKDDETLKNIGDGAQKFILENKNEKLQAKKIIEGV